MTPETPDPPPVSPDQWTLAQEYFDRHVTETQQTLTQVESRLDTSIEFKEDRALVAHLQKNLEYFTVRADGIRQLRAERDALMAQVTALETELDVTSAFIARATTGPDSPLNLAVDVEARAVKAEQERDSLEEAIEALGKGANMMQQRIGTLVAERDAAQQEIKALEFTNGSMSEAIDIACSGAIASAKEAQTLREAATWVAYVAGGVGRAGGYPEPGEAEEAMKALVAALSTSPRPQEPRP